MSSPPSRSRRVTKTDVSAARARFEQLDAQWVQSGRRQVSDEEVGGAEQLLKVTRERIQQLKSMAWLFCRMERFTLHVGAKIGVWKYGGVIAASVFGTAAVAVAVLPLLLVIEQTGLVFVCLACAFAVGFLYSLAVFARARQLGIPRALASFEAAFSERERQLAALAEETVRLEALISELRRLKQLEHDCAEAKAELEKLAKKFNDRRQKLIHCDWRSFRGEQFEEFVAEVFEELGYRVRFTKASGDQGVDLIAVSREGRIAIQCKGYSGSVGNSSVQQVFAGMVHYGCDECVVVTNSSFTSGARELARSVGCRLVDARDIVPLIRGELF